VKKKLVRIILVGLFLVSMPLIFSCDTKSDKHPYLVINVNYSGTVNATNKLIVVFYYLPNWTNPWLTLNYSSKQIIIPNLNIGTNPLYFAIVYDTNGSGTVDTGDLYQGWYNVINPADTAAPVAPLTKNVLAPLVLPNTDMVMLDFDLDKNSTI
jgi:hypothetical protein